MQRGSPPKFHRLAGRIALRVTVLYVVLGIAWIVLSDRLLVALVDDPRTLTWMQTIKGWAYVGVTALLLYCLILWQTRRIAGANEALEERDRHVTRLNRVYSMLNAINGAILRIRDRDRLLDETCRIAVDRGGFPLAWVGLVEGGGMVRPVASAGEGLDCLDGLVLRIDPAHTDAHAMAADLAAGRPFVINDLAAVPVMDKCHARALELGFRALAVMPILAPSRLLGVIGLFVRPGGEGGAPEYFDDDELQLLSEVAADTGIGLTLIEQARALDRAARYDPLTGLANRNLLEERIGQSLLRAQRQDRCVGVLAVEVAGLRAVVDSLGRQQGDRLQQAVAHRLNGLVRDGDTVAYLGNGEFAVLLSDVHQAFDFPAVAEKLLRPFEMELQPDAPPYFVSLSAGAAVFPGDADTADGLIQCAGVALHQGGVAPRLGQCTFYAPEMDDRVREYQALDNELKGALQRGEMHLHYQPIVHTDNGEILGVEALLRWHNRRFGAVPPDRFIPIAEHTGLIRSIGAWVLDEACRQIARWRELGWDRLHMSVNVSVRQLLAPGFEDQVREAVQRHGFDTDDMPLVLEVTETAVIDDMEAVSEALFGLKHLGIAVHLDDFGTGYASLSYLHRLPVDALKVDKSFVQSLGTDPVAENLVRTVVVLARNLDMSLVAEGVETFAQRDMLREFGCDLAQGYLFARPQPAVGIDRLLAEARKVS